MIDRITPAGWLIIGIVLLVLAVAGIVYGIIASEKAPTKSDAEDGAMAIMGLSFWLGLVPGIIIVVANA